MKSTNTPQQDDTMMSLIADMQDDENTERGKALAALDLLCAMADGHEVVIKGLRPKSDLIEECRVAIDEIIEDY